MSCLFYLWSHSQLHPTTVIFGSLRWIWDGVTTGRIGNICYYNHSPVTTGGWCSNWVSVGTAFEITTLVISHKDRCFLEKHFYLGSEGPKNQSRSIQ